MDPDRCACGAGCRPTTRRPGKLQAALNADYERLTGSTPRVFCCPVCLRHVEQRCISEGHAPGRDLGGWVVVLVCRRCNSFLGSRYEAETVRMMKHQRAVLTGEWIEPVRAGSGQPGRSMIDVEARLVGDIRKGVVREIHLSHPKRGSSAARRWNEEVAIARSGGGIRTRQSPADDDAVGRGFLSWAYQSLAGVLGYTFALSPSARLVATALLDPTSTVLGHRFRLGTPKNVVDLVDLTPAGTILHKIVNDGQEVVAGFGWIAGDFLCLFPLPWDREGAIYRYLDEAGAGDGDYGTSHGTDPGVIADLLVNEEPFDPAAPPSPPPDGMEMTLVWIPDVEPAAEEG